MRETKTSFRTVRQWFACHSIFGKKQEAGRPTQRCRAFILMLATPVFSLQVLPYPALAENSSLIAAVTPAGSPSEKVILDTDALLKAVGPLHLSEGKVVMHQNQITVFSDAHEAAAEAELSGAIIEAHVTDEAGVRTIHGIAIFSEGFSIPALDDSRIKEIVTGNDGQERVGRIIEVTPKMLRIRTAQGVLACPTGYITDVKSPRAFVFTMPSPAVPEQKSLITFNPTYSPDPNAAPPPAVARTLHAQLNERRPGKRALKVAALTGGIIACFAIPTAIALICPRPKTAGSSSSGSGQ